MSELINTRDNYTTIRWKLLTSASALALMVSSVSVARAEDTDHPLLWIELGGQMENISGQGEIFTPAFLAANPTSSVLGPVTPLQAQKPPPFSFGEEGKLTFQPEDSDWVFSAAVRIGRSSNFRHVDHQTKGTFHTKYLSGAPRFPTQIHTAENFADTQVHHRESHAVLDFSAGKDVGLGLFGKDSSSVISAGVRFAQFTSKSAFDIRARPDLEFKYRTLAAYGVPTSLKLPHFHTYHATGQASRSFRGVGPSLSWNGSAPFAGNPHDGEITFDWGANAGILFGKQKTHVRHQESAHYVSPLGFLNPDSRYQPVYYHPSSGHPTDGHDSDRSVTVPNVGGFAGISFQRGDAKVSFGYRADFFFGAIDGGIDARKSETLGFKGPFASISVGFRNGP